ncbi:hypothetical protein ISS86_02105 [Candidatus Microgenomates bacterium]|nr:hypothetical protein [Candidatus Microgenomates bacterium]
MPKMKDFLADEGLGKLIDGFVIERKARPKFLLKFVIFALKNLQEPVTHFKNSDLKKPVVLLKVN